MNSSVNPSCDIVFILCWKKMKVQPHIPFMDLLSWVSLYGFPEKIYIYIWEKVLFQNIEYLRMALILVLRSWHFTKLTWQSKGQDLKISKFEECLQLSFRKNIKNHCSTASESYMLNICSCNMYLTVIYSYIHLRHKQTKEWWPEWNME